MLDDSTHRRIGMLGTTSTRRRKSRKIRASFRIFFGRNTTGTPAAAGGHASPRGFAPHGTV